MDKKTGKIFLVGAGPGDPDLVALKAVRAIGRADVLVYDNLVHPDLLTYAAPSCEKIYVGKKAGRHSMPQKEINRLIVSRAESGAVVTRLKGGDPFVFGRGGEEALAAAESGIPFEVVPGITAGVGVADCAGIPLTHRRLASTVTFVTGHEDPAKGRSEIDWPNLARSSGTLVFYMGLGRIREIAGSLLAHGMKPATPAAVIRQGTLPDQRTVVGTLANIAGEVQKAGLEPPAIIVVGRVVRLRKSLSWFESRPLFGRTILVTRSRKQAGAFSGLLRERGASVIELPTIRISPSPEPQKVEKVLNNLDRYDWIVFTSANGVVCFLEALAASGKDIRSLGQARLAAIGPATAEELEKCLLKVDLVPDRYIAEAVAESLAGMDSLDGKKVLLLRAQKAREALPAALRNLGAQVDEVPLYTTTLEEPENVEEIRQALALGQIDALTFTSGSTVENFVRLLGQESVRTMPSKVAVACIGPVTAARAEELGLKPGITPGAYTVESLAEALCKHFSSL